MQLFLTITRILKKVNHEDAQGRPWRAYQDIDPHEAQIRMACYETPMLILAGGGLCLMLFITWLVCRWVLCKKLEIEPAAHNDSSLSRSACRLMDAVSGLHLSGLVMMVVLAGGIALQNPLQLMGSMEQILTFPLAFLLFVAVLSVTLPVFVWLSWKNSWGTWGQRTFYSLVSLVAVGYVFWLQYWNLLGWHF